MLAVANHQAVLSAVRHHLGMGIIVAHLVWKEVQTGSIVIVRNEAKQAVNRISAVQLLEKVPTLTEKKFLAHFDRMVHKSKTLGRLKLRIKG